MCAETRGDHSLRRDAARPKGRGVESGHVDESAVRSSRSNGVPRDGDVAIRLEERGYDVGPDLVPLARNRGAERGGEAGDTHAPGLEGVEGRVEDARGGPAPARVDGRDPARDGIREEDRNAIRGCDGEEHIFLAGDDGISSSEDSAPALTRRFFDGEHGSAMYLRKAHDLGVRRAEGLGEGAAGSVGVQRLLGQNASREARRETRRQTSETRDSHASF